MYPIIFQYNNLTISSYGLMLMLSFLSCNYLMKRYFISINKDSKIADDLIFFAAIGGILGSKIYYIIEFWNTGEGYNNILGFIDIFKGLFSFNFNLLFSGITQFGSGLVFLGGLIGGIISVSFYVYKNNLNWFTVSDWVAPYLALGHSIGRVGCFLVGDCYGRPCTLPWAISFENGLPPTSYESFKYNYPDSFEKYNIDANYSYGDIISVHPTQLYEFILYFVLFLYLINVRKNKQYSGEIFLEYLFYAGFVRFIIEFFRLNPTYYVDLSGAQYISILMVLVSSILMYRYRNIK